MGAISSPGKEFPIMKVRDLSLCIRVSSELGTIFCIRGV